MWTLFLSGESLLSCSPEIDFCCVFFSALLTEVRLLTRIHLCIPKSVSVWACVWAFYAKVSYTREVKNHSYASCELIRLR